MRAECLEYALRVNERLGIWGGLNEGEREQIAYDAARAALSSSLSRYFTFTELDAIDGRLIPCRFFAETVNV